MMENKKKTSIVFGDTSTNSDPEVDLLQEKKSRFEKLKKPLIFTLMAIVFIAVIYLIFKPDASTHLSKNLNRNDSVPMASEAILQGDKQKAYEQETLNQKDQEKQNALLSLSEYWNSDKVSNTQEVPFNNDPIDSPEERINADPNTAVMSYRAAQNTLNSFYKEDVNHSQELQKQIEQLKEQLKQKNEPKSSTVENQLVLMEKSYQMAAKYLPSTIATPKNEDLNTKSQITTTQAKTATLEVFTKAKKSAVSSLQREETDSVFLSSLSSDTSKGFSSFSNLTTEFQSKNSIRAVVENSKELVEQSPIALRLLEPAKIDNHTISPGTVLIATAKFQQGRLQLEITSIELSGTIIPVSISVYDLDGQKGLLVPYSVERSALTQMAGNMSQQAGSSLMLTGSTEQQMVADLSRSITQGISGYFSKKVKTPKVTLKAGHEVLLVSKK